MEIKIHPPPNGVALPWTYTWYNLDITDVTLNITNSIQEYKIKSKTDFYFEQYLHSTTEYSIVGVLTENSAVPGLTLTEKVENLINTSVWWSLGDQRYKTNCARISIYGYTERVIIERVETEISAGDSNECRYSMTLIIHDGE